MGTHLPSPSPVYQHAMGTHAGTHASTRAHACKRRYVEALSHPMLGACNLEIPGDHRLSGRLRNYITRMMGNVKVGGAVMGSPGFKGRG